MSRRKIISVGFQLASEDAKFVNLEDKASLLDWDVILLRPDISGFYTKDGDSYKGKPCLTDQDSFLLTEACEYWRRETKQAFETGKTVIVFLSPLEEVYVDTGERQYSGTGRNRSTTRMVSEYNNYNAIPLQLSPIATSGREMALSTAASSTLASFWDAFGTRSKYEVIIGEEKLSACIVTKSGSRKVGVIARSKTSSGVMLLLPDIDFNPEEFTKQRDGGLVYTQAADKFARQFLSEIASLDHVLQTSSEVSPEPAWGSDDDFALAPEIELKKKLIGAERDLEAAQARKEGVIAELKGISIFRALLYEKGKPLEGVIIAALKLMGFQASNYKEATSEFDVVFESPEGRFIGEAEGKDNKAVNVDKLRQLAMNINEDLAREEVLSPAKPVLFGNAFRLQHPSERQDPFTEKCKLAAIASSTALVSTVDLFISVQALLEQYDSNVAAHIRKTILNTSGRVAFELPARTLVDQKSAEMEVKEKR